MPDPDKLKVLSYRRAEFFTPQPAGLTLQDYLLQAHNRFPNIEHRRITLPGRPDLEGRNWKSNGNAFFLHIAAYTPGEEATVVPKLQGVPSGDIATTPPPDRCEFMDGDITALVHKNHIILCSSNLHEKNAETYMVNIVLNAQINDTAGKFTLSKVAQTSKIDLIRRQGVKSVSLDANLYNATLQHVDRRTVSKRIGANLGEILSSVFGKDQESLDLDFAENLSVKVILTFDQRKKSAALTGERLEAVAEGMLDEVDEGFSITTKGGEKIRPDDVVLKKQIRLPRFGKTVYCASAWEAMENYLLELQDGGLLEQ